MQGIELRRAGHHARSVSSAASRASKRNPIVLRTACCVFPVFRAGGLSVLASAIVERALSGDFFTARKLGFAQQIVSGYVGGGKVCFFFGQPFFSNPFFSPTLFQQTRSQKTAVVIRWLVIVTRLRVVLLGGA